MLDLKLMIVEDDAGLRELMQQIFSREVRCVQSYASGIDALADFEVFEPQVVITDLRMPKMSGMQLLQELRQKSPTLPVIIASAFSEQSYLDQAQALGVQHFAVKPIDIDQLLGFLKTLTQDSVTTL